MAVDVDSVPDSGEAAGALLHNLTLFTRLLRAAGFTAGSDDLLAGVDALKFIDINNRCDFYFALRAAFVTRREELDPFRLLFDHFWRVPHPAYPLPPRDAQGAMPGLDQDGPTRQGESESAVVGVRLGRSDEASGADGGWAGYSPAERLRRRDFSALTRAEREAVARLLQRLGERQTRLRPRRRRRTARRGDVDWGRTMALSRRTGGEVTTWLYSRTKERPQPLLIFADISGSMALYTDTLLPWLWALARWPGRRVEVFLFATRISRVTTILQTREADIALAQVSHQVEDWAGGTRLGQALMTFEREWGGGLMSKRPVTLIISDGWDRGDPALLGRAVTRLRRSSTRLVWLNPLLGDPAYAPLTRGMAAARPFIDDFLAAHNLESIEALIGKL